MSIIDKIKESVEARGLAFEYGAGDDLNEVISEHDFDGGKLCYCTLMTTGTATMDVTGRWHDQVQIALFIVDKTDYDPEAIENERIIDDCKREVFKWLVSVKNITAFKVVSVNGSQRVYDEFDDIVTGYGIQATIEDKQGVGPCDVR